MKSFGVGRMDHLRNSQDDLFSDDFGIKVNTLVTNLAHIFILQRILIILFKNIHLYI
jgi:hypothetical protein